MKYGIPTSEGAGIFLFGAFAMAQRVILIRHGDLGAEYSGRYIGKTDVPLSAEGRLQAAALASSVSRLGEARVLCSPRLRARETAGFALGIGSSFAIDDDLREIDFGHWEGMSFAEIATTDPSTIERWAALDEAFAFPGGEGIKNFGARIGAAADRISADPAGTVIAFTHGGVIRLFICHFLGLGHRHYLLFDVRPGSLSEIRIEKGKGVLTRLNDCCHLESI
jgi:broad specificity phosphatase PhoE